MLKDVIGGFPWSSVSRVFDGKTKEWLRGEEAQSKEHRRRETVGHLGLIVWRWGQSGGVGVQRRCNEKHTVLGWS